jgi:PGF-pre-PGF domain-containing protein
MKKVLIILALIFLVINGLNAFAVDPKVVIIQPDQTDGNVFNADFNIDFNVYDSDEPADMNAWIYFSSSAGGKETLIVDLNLFDASTSGCSDTNFAATSGVICRYTWDVNSLVGDGNWFIDVNVYDITNVDFNIVSSASFMVDQTAPDTNALDYNVGWQTVDANVTFRCNDTNSGCGITRMRIDMDAGDTTSYADWNLATEVDASDLNALFTSDGNWAIDFNSSDAAGNQEDLNTIYILIDSTAPTITDLTLSTQGSSTGSINITTSEESTCRYSGTDQAYSAMGSGTTTSAATTHGWTVTGLGLGTHTYYVRCQDTNVSNESSTTTVTFTTSYGGTDTGTGTGTETDTGDDSIETDTPNIDAGSSYTKSYNTTDHLIYVKLYAEENMDNTTLTLTENLNAETEEITEPNNTYQIFKLTLDNTEGLEKAKIKFKITKEWMTNNNYNTEDITLQRLVDGEWTELETTYQNDTTTHNYFTAITPGFSYFAITAQPGTTPTEEETPEPEEETTKPEEEETPEPTPTTPEPTPTTPEPEPTTPTTTTTEQPMDLITPIIIILLAAIIVGAAIMFLGKKPKQGKKNKLGYP